MKFYYYLCIQLFLKQIVLAKSYPLDFIYEWTAVEDNGSGWGLDGNFYVVTDYEGAVPKLGVALGMRPPADHSWTEDGYY